MSRDPKEEIALFRFGVISELVSSRLAAGELTERIHRKSERRWDIPHSNRTRLSASTIRRWLRLYERSGRELSSLYPESRSDRGRSRKIDEETVLALVRLRKNKPEAPVKRLLVELEEKKLCPPGMRLSLTTAYRILQREGLTGKPAAAKIDRRRYEAEFPNDIWQSDVMHGPSLLAGDRKRKTYLIAFLDDHSRLLPHAEFFLSENLHSWLVAFRRALLTRGLPRKLYVDNGAAFRSRHLERICASLGIALTHTPPYTPQGRGKIERFFRTVRTEFLSCFQGETFEELNVCLDLWLREQYHNRIHSSTGQTPLNRFADHLEMVRAAPIDLEDHFRKEVRRRVTKDRIVTIDGRLFEVPTRLIGEQVSLLFMEDRPERVEIFHQGQSYGLLTPLDLRVNSQVGRDETPPAGRQGRLPFMEEQS